MPAKPTPPKKKPAKAKTAAKPVRAAAKKPAPVARKYQLPAPKKALKKPAKSVPYVEPVVTEAPKPVPVTVSRDTNIRVTTKHDGPITLYPDRAPWDYHPWETVASYNMFQIYMRMGTERSVAKAVWESWHEEKKLAYQVETDAEAEKMRGVGLRPRGLGGIGRMASVIPGGNARFNDKHCSAAGNWCNNFLWTARAFAWDNHLLKIEQNKLIEARTEAAGRMADSGKRLHAVAMGQVKKWEDNPNLRLGVKDTLAIISESVKLEKAGLGIDDETAQKIGIQNNVQIDLGNLSLEDMAKLRELRNKVIGAPSNVTAKVIK